MISVVLAGATITSLVSSIDWTGDITLPYRSATVSFINTDNGVNTLIDVKLGSVLYLYEDGIEVFRGIVFKYDINSNGEASIVSHDENFYLLKNFDSKRYDKKTATFIIRNLCTQFGVSIGTIAETGYIIPKLILRDMSIWDMMTTALTETRAVSGRRFYVYSKGGKLHLVERKERVAPYAILRGKNMLSAGYSKNAEELKTQVKVIALNDKADVLLATDKSASVQGIFGQLQHVERVDKDTTKAQAQLIARNKLKELAVINDEARIESMGFIEAVSGSCVYVRDSVTKILGAYYITADSHRIENGVHTMTLTISATDELPSLKYTNED